MISDMKVGLFGQGKMGKLVAQMAEEKGYQVVTAEEAEVCIDFSHHSIVLDHVKWAIAHNTPLIIGTTGWEEDENEVRSLIEKSSIAALASPNFSLGVACFTKLLRHARALLQDYSVAGVEFHHSQKQDAPSGTAKALAHALQISTPFASVRCGRIPGKHEVIFDSPWDSITLVHEAHNRESFAAGALTAAYWIQGKTGWYSIDDMLRDLYSTHHPL